MKHLHLVRVIFTDEETMNSNRFHSSDRGGRFVECRVGGVRMVGYDAAQEKEQERQDGNEATNGYRRAYLIRRLYSIRNHRLEMMHQHDDPTARRCGCWKGTWKTSGEDALW